MVTQLGQELELRLERLRARAANGTDTVRSPAIVLIGRVIANRLELPWEAARPTPVREPQVAALLESGNQAEFADQRFAEAATLYARAARIASDAATRAEASLMAARVSVRAGDTASALARYRDLIEVPLSLRDDDGVPYPVYAADALARWPASASLAVRSLQQAMLTADLPPTAIYAVRDVSARLVAQADGTLRDSAEALARKTEEKLRATERTLALQREFPALRTFAERAPARTNAAALWIPFSADTASEPWLVSVPLAAAAGADTGVVVVARAAPILAEIAADGSPVAAAARAARITANEPAGQPLGDAFPGVRVHFPGGLPGADARRFGESFLLFALPLVLGIMLFSAYLLWRDVR